MGDYLSAWEGQQFQTRLEISRRCLRTNWIGLLASEDPASFAEKVFYIIEHPDVAENLGNNARDLAIKEYEWKILICRLENFYYSILNNQTPNNNVSRKSLMKLRNPTKLIPRNNWDYGFKALFIALAGADNNATQAPNIENSFKQRPVWTNSGRTSLYAILKSLELPAGAKVGVPLFCCSVVFNAICQAGLSPCFIDSNMNDCNISVEDLRKKWADLAAVVAVHMFGNPCDMDAIVAIAGPVPVIEDCAQSIFSTYKGKQTGMLSTASFFSFRCGKYISAGEGSAIFCRELELQNKVERLVNSFERWSTFKKFINSFSNIC